MSRKKLHGRDLLRNPNVPRSVKDRLIHGGNPPQRSQPPRPTQPPHSHQQAQGQGEGKPFRERMREYFRPMTPEEARIDEEERQKHRTQSPDRWGGRTVANSRFGRDVSKGYRSVTGGVKKGLEAHAKWVDEGNKRASEEGGQTPQGSGAPGGGGGRGSPFVRTGQYGRSRRGERESRHGDDIDVLNTIGYPTRPVRPSAATRGSRTDFEGLGDMFAWSPNEPQGGDVFGGGGVPRRGPGRPRKHQRPGDEGDIFNMPDVFNVDLDL